VAAHFVAAHPDAVRPLILVNPIAAPALEGPKGLMTRLAVLYYRLSARLPRPLGLALLRSPLIVRVMSMAMAKTKDRDLLRFIHGQHHAYFSAFANRDSLLESFTASVSSNVAEVAPSSPCPCCWSPAKRTKSPCCGTSTAWPGCSPTQHWTSSRASAT
jgi:pimeloyl-ACP methyl ester carboxylesterase